MHICKKKLVSRKVQDVGGMKENAKKANWKLLGQQEIASQQTARKL